jgi:hypothetical protein
MINWFCGVICGSGTTLLLYSLFVGKRIQEEQDKACKCIYKYEEYRRKIRTLEYQKHELEKKLESSKYSGDYLGFEETK